MTCVFSPSTPRIAKIYTNEPQAVRQLQQLLSGSAKVYIDYANVRPWSEKLKWHVDPKRVLQFYRSFDVVQDVLMYQGTLAGDAASEKEAEQLSRMGFTFRTKPVKIMHHSIDASSIPKDSTSLISQFMRKALIRQLDIESVEYLNGKLRELNKKGVFAIEDRKCNFDVEIGTNMMVDAERGATEVYCLWSGDSDFADVVEQLLRSGKKVVLFATARRVSSELNQLRATGLFVFDIAKIRNYICWPREMTIRA